MCGISAILASQTPGISFASMTVKIPIPKEMASGETRSYQFLTSAGSLVVHVTYRMAKR